MAQAFVPHPPGMQQHPGVPQGHPMGQGLPSNPGQPGGGGPGMPPQMHPGVSGVTGPQVSQGAGPAMGGLPPGAVGPGQSGPGGAGPSAHALSHLNPGQAQQLFQQQQQQQQHQIFQQAVANNPQLLQQHQQQLLRQRQQAFMQSQQGGMPVGLPNGANPGFTPAQFAAMQNNPALRPVTLPQHMQQQQLVAQHQQQHQHQQHQQMLAAQAQQMAMQQANAAAHAGNPGQPTQPGQQPQQQQQQQLQGLQNAQALAAAQQQQQQQQQQSQQQQQQQQHHVAQQRAAAAAAMMQPQTQMSLKGTFVLQMLQFGDHLGQFTAERKQPQLPYWQSFVERFFSHTGVSRQILWNSDDQSTKAYEISTPALPRYYCTHFESGVRNIQMILENAREKELPNNCHHVESPKASFIYWFDSGNHVIASGTLRAQFDQNSKIDLLEFVTTDHKEFLQRSQIKTLISPHNSPDQKSSPKQTKTMGKQKAQQRPPPPPPVQLPESQINNNGVTDDVSKFLETAEAISRMRELFNYSQQNAHLTPAEALIQLVSTFQSGAGVGGGGTQGMNFPAAALSAQQQQAGLQNNIGITGQFPLGASPSMAHLNLPNSPHVGNQPSPVQTSGMQAPGLMAQHSQQGTNSSQGTSVSTSPNVQNKRRRPSGVKAETDEAGGVPEANGTSGGAGSKVKASPRVGKRQKANPS